MSNPRPSMYRGIVTAMVARGVVEFSENDVEFCLEAYKFSKGKVASKDKIMLTTLRCCRSNPRFKCVKVSAIRKQDGTLVLNRRYGLTAMGRKLYNEVWYLSGSALCHLKAAHLKRP